MRKNELQEILNSIKGNPLVVLSRDAEGNGFKELVEVELMAFEDGEIWYRELTDELIFMGFTEEDINSDAEDAIILWP